MSPDEEHQYEARVSFSLTLQEIVKLLVVEGEVEAVIEKVKDMDEAEYSTFVLITGLLTGVWRKIEAEGLR